MEVNWSHCIICQENIFEPLRCPLHSPGASNDKVLEIYEAFLSNIKQFWDISDLPTNIYFQNDQSAADLCKPPCFLVQILLLEVQQFKACTGKETGR